jgi:hypothetical protein
MKSFAGILQERLENLCIRKVTKEREMARMSAEVRDWGEVCELSLCVTVIKHSVGVVDQDF